SRRVHSMHHKTVRITHPTLCCRVLALQAISNPGACCKVSGATSLETGSYPFAPRRVSFEVDADDRSVFEVRRGASRCGTGGSLEDRHRTSFPVRGISRSKA
ncbi:MAG: hypothetical protein ACRESZ_05950, partial [Methylococcales bacterium]